MLTIQKVLNNNCVIALVPGMDDEVIVSGSGVGYNKRAGMPVSKAAATKIYTVQNVHKDEFYKLIERVELKFIIFAEFIVQYANSNLHHEFNPSLHFILADHIANVVSRHRDGLDIENVFIAEIRALYQQEYKISRDIVSMINSDFNIQLPDDEAGFITIHLLNNYSSNIESPHATKVIRLTKNVLSIIESHYGRRINTSSIFYSRLLTHIKYFACRIIQGTEFLNSDMTDICENLMEKDLALQSVIKDIKRLIIDQYNHNLTNEEILYLSIHIKVLMH